MIGIKQEPEITDHSKLLDQFHKVVILYSNLSTIGNHNHGGIILSKVTEYNLLHHELDKSRLIKLNGRGLRPIDID